MLLENVEHFPGKCIEFAHYSVFGTKHTVKLQYYNIEMNEEFESNDAIIAFTTFKLHYTDATVRMK